MSEMLSITSPIPGVFYRRPSPEEAPYVELGARVGTGDTIGLIEIMKSFHPVLSSHDGFVSWIADDYAEVSPGMVLAEVQPAQDPS